MTRSGTPVSRRPVAAESADRHAPREGFGSDEMTSRVQFVARLREALKPASRKAGWSLILVGIDHLGRMNDTFGYEVVDQVVAEVVRIVRLHAPAPCLISRFSGSTFAIFAQGHSCVEETEAFAGDLCAAVRRVPVETSAGPLPVSITAGGMHAPERAVTLNGLLAAIEEAHDRAKHVARGFFRLYERKPARERLRRANQRAAEEIVRAIWDDRICLALQPVVDIATRQIVFHEALARIAPVPGIAAKDMPHVAEAAERLGLIGALDRQVLALAIRALRRDPALRLSVNVSPLSVADHGWQQVFAAEATADIAPRLILELTESAVVQDLDAARSFVRLARERGAQVAIDDFGAGSTSFRNLRSLGVDMVKIDGSFVRNMERSPDDRAFVRALIQLARQLQITTVAEWVQSEDVARYLRAEGCDLIQGELTGLAAPYAVPCTAAV